MIEKSVNYGELRRIFELYSIYLHHYIVENQNGHSPYEDAIFVIANGDDKLGDILVKTLSCKIMSEELFYEGQPYIICGKTSPSVLVALLKKINQESIALKIDNCFNVPVIVADNGSLEIFDYLPKSARN